MKKYILSVILLFIASSAFAAGQGLSTWTAMTYAIADADLFGITDISDTTQSSDGSSRKVTGTQIKSWLDGRYAKGISSISAPGNAVIFGTDGYTLADGGPIVDLTLSSHLSTAITDEVGTGYLVFNADPIFTGSLQLPNGANPTTDAAGEIAIDTSTGAGQGIRAYGALAFFIPAYQTKCTTINAAAAASDFMVERFPYAITIRAVHVTQIGATNVIGHIDECDANGANCATVDSTADITAESTTANDDGTLSNPSIDAGDVIAWHTTSVSGTNTQLMICFDYTVDQVN
jgi:hypothetical protein